MQHPRAHPAPPPAQAGFLLSTALRCTQGALPEPSWQSAPESAVCLPQGNALKATCGHDPAVASCAVGWGLHGFFFSRWSRCGFIPLVLVSLGMHPAGLNMCLWSHSLV